MLIYAKFLYIFQSSILVDIHWSVPKPGRTNMVSTYQCHRFKDSTPMFWLLGSACMDLCLYRVYMSATQILPI